MHDSADMMRQLAGRILEIERASDQLSSTPVAAFQVCERLRTSLSPLAGVAGYRSLLSRAVSLASVEVEWLKTITVKPDGSLSVVDAAERSAEEIASGETILIAQLVGLLVTFVGETLTLRLLQDAWPEISRGDMSSGPET